MTLGGLNLADNFPVIGQTFEYIRPDVQGPAIKKINITLSGFYEGNSAAGIQATFVTLRNTVGLADLTTLTYIHDSVTLHSNRQVYVSSYNEPEDLEFARNGVGDYSIELYYFENQDDNLPITCTYGTYTFEKTPKWGRRITPIRESHRAPLKGSLATIGLSGFLRATSHAELMTKINDLQAAFQTDQILTYGSFVQAVRAVDVTIEDTVILHYAFFQINLAYDIGAVLLLNRRIRISRVHQNPVITEEPFCNRRLIELMNSSGQTITYSWNATSSASLAQARTTIQTDAGLTIEAGGIEMPGGEETWNPDTFEASMTVTKFYNTPPIPNLF